MNILYGIQGTGNGHISRCRVMAKYLAEQPNVKVTYLFSGREKKKFFDMEVFGDYLHRDGLTFVTKAGKIDYLATLRKNNLIKFLRDIRQLDVSEYDLVITDFEPVSAWAAKNSGVPTLAIGHQYAFGSNTPLAGENFIAKMIMKYFAPAQQAFGLHWSNYDDNVLPPIIDVSLQKSLESGPVLVYLPFEDQQAITKLLNTFPAFEFVQYSQDLIDRQQGNVALRTTCHDGFKADLQRASGVICNSGFELNSECIHLGIPILTKPINGQMEQESNALAIEQLGLGKVMLEIDSDIISEWLNSKCQAKQMRTPDVALTLVEWILSDKRLSQRELSQQLWQSAAMLESSDELKEEPLSKTARSYTN
ncbi:MJ1255/VC2487 family glycosyltransferase [Thalassotalea fusca]